MASDGNGGEQGGDASSIGGDTASQPELMDILRTLAETQRLMTNQLQSGGGNRGRILSTLKLPPFDGDVRTSVYK